MTSEYKPLGKREGYKLALVAMSDIESAREGLKQAILIAMMPDPDMSTQDNHINYDTIHDLINKWLGGDE